MPTPVIVARQTSVRLEHIDAPDGDGYARFHIVRRDLAHDDFGSRYDADWYRTVDARNGFLRSLIDSVKGRLLFWR